MGGDRRGQASRAAPRLACRFTRHIVSLRESAEMSDLRKATLTIA